MTALTHPAPPTLTTVRRHGPLLLFEIAGRTFALPLADVREILPLPELARPPLLPALLAGFLNLGGAAVPVVRLDRLLGCPAIEPGRYTPLILLRPAAGGIALLVERVHGIATPADAEMSPLPEDHAFNDCVTALAPHHGQTVAVLSAARLLLEKEQQCLAELQDREQQRLQALEEAGA